MEIEDIVTILEIVTAVILWPTSTIISEYVPWADILIIVAHAMQLPELSLRWCEEEELVTQPCRSPAVTDQALEVLLQPAVALLTAWSVTILRSVDFVKANSKFSRAEREVLLPRLGDLILKGLIKHQQHPLSGVLAILATRLTMKVGRSDVYSPGTLPRKKLKAAIEAGQRCASNLHCSAESCVSLTTCLMLLINSFACSRQMQFLCALYHMLDFLDQFCVLTAHASKSAKCFEAPDICFTERLALDAGLRSESLLQLVGPDDAVVSARGHGIRRLIANVMLGVFPCLEDNADCLFPPLAAWQVHHWWLPKASTTQASVRSFQVCHSLAALQ